jgi:acetyltransferase
MRYLHVIKLSQRVAHERLTRICFIDYDREMALVTELKDPQTGQPQVIAVGRLRKVHGTRDAEFAALITDEFQARGLGSELLRRLIQIGRDERVGRIVGDILPDNEPMQRVCENVGFKLSRSVDDPVVKAELVLES